MTTPYVTGTVSVTAGSPIVTGTGTGWQTAGLVAGQFGVDGLSVPVLSIDSDTKITLAKNWPGATASGKAYWITYDTTPGQQTVANAQRLAEYIARLDKPALAALASLVPAADKLPYFGAGGAGALLDFNAAARAFLTGGQLPNAQVRNDLTPDKAFRRGNILGIVSQSAGVPTGAQFEYGSNANGEYVRFADGTQICCGAGDVSASTALTNHFGSTSGSSVTGNASISFPASFSVNTYRLTANVTFRGFNILGAYSKAVGSCVARFGVSGTTTSNVPFDWIAIGRWF